MISYRIRQSMKMDTVRFVAILLLFGGGVAAQQTQPSGQEHALQIMVNPADGKYAVAMPGSNSYALRAGVGVEVDGHWLHASDYPRHAVEHSQAQGYLGDATDWQVTYSGLSGQPDLTYHLRAYSSEPFGDIEVTVRNSTGRTIHVESIRSVDANEGAIIVLGGPVIDDRVLSDSFSEDRPGITVRDLADAEQQMHRAVGSQLIYNRRSTTAGVMRACFWALSPRTGFSRFCGFILPALPAKQFMLQPTRSIRPEPPRWRRKILSSTPRQRIRWS